MGRTLEAYIVDKGLDLTTAEFKSQIIGATVMADVIKGFLTLKKWGYYSGAIHPKHIFFSQEYMNAHLYPVFCQRDEVTHEKPEDLFPYYSRTRENKICQNAEFHAMGFLYLQMRLQDLDFPKDFHDFQNQGQVYAHIRQNYWINFTRIE